MPHIIVEYSNNLPEADIPALLTALHEGLSAQGIDKARIKTRAIRLDDYIVGDKGASGKMVHVTLLILEGRDLETKKQFADPLYETLQNQIKGNYPDCAVTLEVRDMNKDTYYL